MTELSATAFALPAPPRPRVALLVDGDNLSATRAGKLIVQAAREGDPIIRRVYGAPGGLLNWDKAQGFHPRYAGPGKNAADLLLTVEAMDLMLTGKADVLVIASSDRDFSHLATHLRETGRRVVGIGEEKAPEHFLHCCSAHHVLPDPTEEVITPTAKAPDPLVAALSGLILKHGTLRAIPISQLGQLARQETGKTLAELGRPTWRAVLLDHPDRFTCDPKGPDARVRLR